MAKKKLFFTNGDESVHLHSENGTAYELSVDNAGSLKVTNEATGEVTVVGGGGLPTGGAPHQQLVTDAEGKALWEDRTHWADGEVRTVLAECTVSDADMSAMATPLAESIVSGTQYRVTYNGAVYDTTAATAELDGLPMVALGNVGALTGGADTGEPFLFAELPAEAVAEMGIYWMVQPVGANAPSSATIKVEFNNETVKKIDDKFLDLAAKRVYTDAVVKSNSLGSGHIYRDPELTDELSFAEAYEILVEYGGKICANTASMTTTGGYPFNPLVVQPMTGWGYFMVGLSDGSNMGRLNLYCSDYISEV